MHSILNDWEADPWDTSDEIADTQLAGFQRRSGQAIAWFRLPHDGSPVFGIELDELRGAEVMFYATQADEDMILMQLAWHGFPDPPEWRLATRPSDGRDHRWSSWGFFADLPEKWVMPNSVVEIEPADRIKM